MNLSKKRGGKVSNYTISEVKLVIVLLSINGIRNLLTLLYEFIPPSIIVALWGLFFIAGHYMF
jgi:hypothetical protein